MSAQSAPQNPWGRYLASRGVGSNARHRRRLRESEFGCSAAIFSFEDTSAAACGVGAASVVVSGIDKRACNSMKQRTSELRLWGAQRGGGVWGSIWAALLVQLDKFRVVLREAPFSSASKRGAGGQRTGLRVVPSPKSSFDAAKPRSSGGGGGCCDSGSVVQCMLAAAPLLGGASGGSGGGNVGADIA